jgi:spermidine synthase
MAGLALGSYLAGRIADKKRYLLKSYAILEVLISLLGLLTSFVIISWLSGLYVGVEPLFHEKVWGLLFVRVIFAIVCLLPPTIAMGATLPLLVAFISRYKDSLQEGLGRLYSINTCGAVFGVFVTGFFLLGQFGESGSVYIAVVLNNLAAILSSRLSSHFEALNGPTAEKHDAPPSKAPAPVMPYTRTIRFWSTVGIFASGFTALAYEILWTRLLMLPLETSIYAFSFMLGTFLFGIALGSWLATRFSSTFSRPVAIFGMIELCIGFWTVVGLAVFPVFEQAGLQGSPIQMLVRIIISIILIFPVAVLFGWQFPIAVRCCVSEASKPGKETGWAFSINTVGAIIGSLATGFMLLPLFGTSQSMHLLAGLNILLGCVILYVAPTAERGRLSFSACALILGFIALMQVVEDPYQKVVFERLKAIWGDNAKIYSYDEGIAGTTVAAGLPQSPMNRALVINGVGMTSLVSETKLMAHLPIVLADRPRRVLVICFGMGTSVRSASRHSDLLIDAVDIVPHVFDCFPYYHSDAGQVAVMPNVGFKKEDGRNYLLVHQDRYDVITIDPAPPLHSAGTVNLYTQEFFQLCKSRISEGGVVCLWLPPAPVSELMMIMKSFHMVFPNMSLWGALGYPGFYLIGGLRSYEQTASSVAEVAKRLSTIEDLREWDAYLSDAEVLKDLFLLNSKDIGTLLEGIPEITDDTPYTEFPLWRNLFTQEGRLIFTSHHIRRAIKSGVIKRTSTDSRAAFTDPDL